MAIHFNTIQQLPGIQIKGSFLSPITGVSIDTRTLKAGELFVAFFGTQVDGHDFIPKAISRGASAVMASTSWAGCGTWESTIPLIMTEDPVKTLADLASAHRQQFDIEVIAITGTNGKTSTKNMLAHVLSTKFKVLATQGNLNNHIGLPMIILSLDPSHELAVIEMGASQSGDIEYLCQIAQPTQGLITNISLAHTEFFHDVETIQRTKGELFSWLGSHQGSIYVNMDDPRVAEIAAGYDESLQFGTHHNYDYDFSIEGPNNQGCFTLVVRQYSIHLPQPGKAAALNAMAAVVMALNNGISFSELKAALEAYPGERGRMQRQVIGEVTFLNDAYNANPASVQAGLETLAAISASGRKVLVFGDMLELGPQSPGLHRQAAQQMLRAKFDFIILFGAETQACVQFFKEQNFSDYFHSCDKAQAHHQLTTLLQNGDLVYLKGSRGMALESFITAYKELN